MGETLKSEVVDYLIANREWIRSEPQFSGLLTEYEQLLQKEKDFFHDDIKNELNKKLLLKISIEVCYGIETDMETVMSVLEDVDLCDFLFSS